ncbi:MAG TPA: N-acetyltransferase [Planctomycetota bacterium]|nr:N-acetyltransferase [Planctomycetota bacterium]
MSNPTPDTAHATRALTVRSACVDDVPAILELINGLAQEQVMLPRSPLSVYEGIRDFVVAEVDGTFAGCGALKVVWADLAEVRSLAVRKDAQKGGIGRALVERIVRDAEALGVPTLFAFTYVPGFFAKLGFSVVQHESLPHKVFSDCMHCPKFMACDEIAMVRQLRPLDAAEEKARVFAAPNSFPLPRRLQTIQDERKAGVPVRR